MNASESLEAGLRRARARLHRDRLTLAAWRAAEGAATTLAVTGGVALIVAIGLAAAGRPTRAVDAAVAVVGGGVALGMAARRWVVAWRTPPSLAETAERLDLAGGTRNAVATALDVLARRLDTPFAAASVDAGLTHLAAHAADRPTPPELRRPLRRVAAMTLVAVVCLIVAALEAPRPLAAAIATVNPRVASEPSATVSRVAATAPAPGSLPASPKGTPADASSVAQAARPAAGISSERAFAAAASGGGAGTNRVPHLDSPVPPPSPATPSEAPRQSGRSDSSAGASAASGGGTGGSGAAAGRGGAGRPSPASPLDWASHDKVDGASPDDAADDTAAVPDPVAVDTHTGALQPLLQDRSPAASRELGIGSPKDGPAGNGRGGPSLQKKSRGVAALLMAVPLPQQLRGQLRAGIARTSESFVPPVAGVQSPAAAAAVPPRVHPEPTVDAAGVSADESETLQRYFAAIHAAPAPEPRP